MPYKDREKQLQAQRDHYKNNKGDYINRNKKRRDERKSWFRLEIMSKLSCTECGENDMACLDFHHIDKDDKKGNVTSMLNDHRSKESVLKEIEKCAVLCANCHRKLHFYEFEDNLKYKK